MQEDCNEPQKKQEVIRLNRFSVCPHCGKRMLLTKAEFDIYLTGDSGWIQRELDKQIKYRMHCMCGYTMDMELRDCGMFPKGFKGNDNSTISLKDIRKVREQIGFVQQDV